ncbi:MAG TPA: hypothetical protein VIP98_07505 [Microlunatus sp.]
MTTTTLTTARLKVTGLPRTPAPFGLFSAVTFRETVDPHWQAGGIEWEHLPCRQLGLIGQPDCWSDSTGTRGLPKDFSDSGPDGSTADPFTVFAPWECSPVGYSPKDARQHATSLLLAGEQYTVERALWAGDPAEPSLTNAVPVTGEVLSPLDGLAILEAAYAGQVGSVGVIHCSRWAATILVKQADLVSTGDRLVTALGTPVIAGSGYGLDDHHGRLVMTPPLFIYRSETFTSSNREGDLLDRATNDLYAIAERTYLIGWDDCPQALYVDIELETGDV